MERQQSSGELGGETRRRPHARAVAIVCDFELVAVGLQAVLAPAEDLEFVGSARTSGDLLELVREFDDPLVVVVADDADRLVRELTTRRGGLVVVVIGADEPEEMRRAIESGARGYISEAIEPAQVPGALARAAAGEPYRIVPEVQPRGEPYEWEELTDREIEILRAVAEGLPNRAIARRLWVTEQTVKFHLTNVFRKLGVRNRTAAARWAFEHGLASSGDEEGEGGGESGG